MTPDAALRQRLAELVETACDGRVRAEEAAVAESLTLIGLDSLATIRLIDAVEQEFAVTLDDESWYLDSVEGLAEHLLGLGVGGTLRGESQ